MNTRKPIQPAATTNVLSISYSTSGKRFITGLSDGIRIFRTDNCLATHEPTTPYELGISIAEVLDDRYCAYVYNHKNRSGGPNVVVFWDALLDRELSRFDFHEPVLGIRLTSKWMAVVLEERTVLFQYQRIHLPRLPTPPAEDAGEEERTPAEDQPVRAPNLVHSIYQTTANTYALACLSNDLLVLPAKTLGQIQLISLKTGASSSKRVVKAHSHPLRCLALSDDGSLLATASEQGTLNHVYNTTTLDQLANFRRGVDQAIVHSMAFSPGNRWLASTSDKGTLHIFDLRPPDAAEVASMAKERQHRKSRSYAEHRLSGPDYYKDSSSGMSAGRSSPAPSSAVGGGAGTGYQGSVQEYYGLRPPPVSASPPARDAAVSAMATLKASPFAPKVFKDIRSIASAPFYTGEDTQHWQSGPPYSWTTAPNGTKKRIKNLVLPLPNDPAGRPSKGIITFEREVKDGDGAIVYVVGGGSDARWEMFELSPITTADGERIGGWALNNKGFRKYLKRQFV
ncbi:hypothetical protein M409DRAFT_50390 [Zasmidium cellare ATCC 36951]|uniref:Uncharacterized protein n=1 Tax=Zasmidium cellare ATCC 36951 TaxID=1080233 RepID=A0A6A6CX56_ZASCE|nr:uncharacterized protein M409DRAFT_50390 [Zasmidium cellare ATCC 36951]KAF2171734.1 hypothetical protein M409DRAFT_50390 [Zasmidium cellare ATCC 36951]